MRAAQGEVAKRIWRPRVGEVSMDYSAFAVEGRPDLDLVVFPASTPRDTQVIRDLLRAGPGEG